MRTPIYIEHLTVPDTTLPNHTKLYIDPRGQKQQQQQQEPRPKKVPNLNYFDSFQSKKTTTNVIEDITTTTTTEIIHKQPPCSPRVQPFCSPRVQPLCSPRGQPLYSPRVQQIASSPRTPGRTSSFSHAQNNYEPHNIRRKASSQNSTYKNIPIINVCPTPNEQLKEPNASGQKQIQIVNLANQLDNKLRKDFIKKQQQLRRQPSRGEDTEVDVDSQALNTGRNFDDVKPKPTIISHSNSITSKIKQPSSNSNSSNSTSSGHRQVVINFEKYKVENQTNEITKQKVNDKKMVSKPAPPRKHNTFNENQSAYYKDAKNKLALNLNQNKRENNQQSNKPNVDIIYFKKPVTRTGSTLMTENTKNLKGRRPPKEFLPDKVHSPRESIEHRQGPNGRTTSRESFYSKESYSKEENFNNDHSNRTLSPATMKSLPSYDEALKRVFSESQSATTKKIPVQQSVYTKSFSNTSKSVDQNANLLLKGKSTLPNLSHTQSTFKSLLHNGTNGNGGNNNMGQQGTNQGSRVYFRPQDLSVANRLVQLNQSPSNIPPTNPVESAKAENELYLLQKNTFEKNSVTGSANKLIIKKLASSSPTMKQESQELPKNSLVNNGGADILNCAPPIENGVTRQASSSDLKNIGSNLPNLIPIHTNPNAPIINNYDFTSSSTKTTNHHNYTTVTKKTEQIQNTVIQKPPSPVNNLGFYPLASSSSSADAINSTNFLSSITTNPISNTSNNSNNQRLKSWTNVNNYEMNMNNLRSPRNLDQIEHKQINVRERTPTPDRMVLTTSNQRQSTINSDDKINTNYSQHYEEELFSPRHHQLNRAASEQRMAGMEKPHQEIEIQLSPGKLVDAVKAATSTNGSTESGLALINEFNKNTQALIGEFNKNGSIPRKTSGLKSQLSNYADTRDIVDTNSYPAQMCSTLRTQNNTKTMSNRNKQHSLDDTFSVSTSSFSESESLNNNNNNNADNNNNNNNKVINKKQRASSNEFIDKNNEDHEKQQNNDRGYRREEEYFLDEISTMNELPSLPCHKLKSKKKSYSVGNGLNSLSSGNSGSKRRLNKINSEETVMQQQQQHKQRVDYLKQISNISKDEASGCRPQGRLNFYDSDTFSENFLINGSPMNRKNFKNNEIILSDSPGLSDLSEDLNGGHRTSTPNMSKKRMGSAPELNFIRKQIEDLEKMYLEIKKMVDPGMDHNFSKTLDNTSSFSSSSDNSNIKPRRAIGARSSSVQRAQRHEEISHLKHRFVRMENNLVQLAKTVAQISVELKTMKTVEDVIKNLTRDVHDLQKLNLGLSNSSTKPGDLYRSTSEPRQLSTSSSNDRLDELNINAVELNTNSKASDNLLPKRKTSKDSAISSSNAIIPNYTNPRKLKKLTKFFGQEPPMLRLFLQKLNYEMYASYFENEHITITELPYLSEERLKMLGIPLGPRLRILQEAQLSFRRENSTRY